MTDKDRRSYMTRYPNPYALRVGVAVHHDAGGPCSACDRDNRPGLSLVAIVKGAWRGRGVTRRQAEATFFVCDECFRYMGYDRRPGAPDVPIVTDTREGEAVS